MGRKRNWPPAVQEHGGKDVIRVWQDGRQHWITLGPAGSAQSRAEYLRVITEAEANGGRLPLEGSSPTVQAVVLAYLEYARGYHVPKQFEQIKRALAPCVEMYGQSTAAKFGPLAFKACRQRFVDAGHCRTYCNALAWSIHGCFRWAAGEELVPLDVPAGIREVPQLRKGKTTAPESQPVRPADPAAVEAALPFLSRHVAAMVRVQRLTGARPGEITRLRPCDLDRSWLTTSEGHVWLYRLDKHKNDWRGMLRWIPIGPQAQALLLPFLADCGDEEYVFRPSAARAEWLAQRRAGRQTPLHRAHLRRYDRQRKDKPQRAPRERYDAHAYAVAVRRACDRAGIERWSPNQLRHLRSTEIETACGREDARCVLGHRVASMTARYAESVQRAALVLARLG